MVSPRFKPWPALAPYLEDLWVQEDAASAAPQAYEVLPSPGFVLGFQFSGRLETLDRGESRLLAESGVTGLQTSARLYRNRGAAGSLLVRFRPWAPAFFFPGPMSGLSGRSVDLKLLWDRQEVSDLSERLREAPDHGARAGLVQALLLKRLKENPRAALLRRAVESLARPGGMVRVPETARELGLGQRRLERWFLREVGLAPKAFASLVRFHRSFALRSSGLEAPDAALEAGYYDQAHFIREFKSFTGRPPEAYFKGLPPGPA